MRDKPKQKAKGERRAAALEYTGIGAPRVVAKGEGLIAARIEEVARQNDIPLIQDALLASVLVNVPLGDEIPENFYFAVAEILAHIYRVSDSIDSYE
ncbi:MAG: EscU/YscU/HrcU family type III secretion system export apparatus switch protein [Porticoccus sp.]|nr:EscU/YscU/HrcU family type III secretion system export apparatus switch protein [Porticoccus sp.]